MQLLNHFLSHSFFRTAFLSLIFSLFLTFSTRADAVFSVQSGGYQLVWDLSKDSAVFTRIGPAARLWKGSLLPAFWLQTASGERQYVKATVAEATALQAQGGSVQLKIGTLGTGVLDINYQSGIVRFTRLTVTWNGETPSIIAMHWGTSPLKADERSRATNPEQPFWPDWEAAGVCIPSAKGNPVQSFFRMWDFGHATLPLGSFGPSLGTPYAAAYPRPIYSCAMGNDPGWLVLGAGSIPDAAMVYQIQSSNGSLQYLYREDLWGKPGGKQRVWNEPLRLAWAATAYDAYDAYFQSFGPFEPVLNAHQMNVWNTWGDFKNRDFNLKTITEKALDFKADALVIDDSWESSQGSGVWHEQRFPNYRDDLKTARSKGLKIGYWQNVVWIEKPEEAGLTADDLLCGADGKPVKTSWNMNPHGSGSFCLDPSSAKTVAFIQNRTRKLVSELKPDLLKLDFGYGIPSPGLATARNPALRGEKLAHTLIKLIAEAAREVNPNITIQYYSIHPLFRDVQNLLALDDLGDAGGREVEGHGQWSLWSSLAARQGMAIMASSGYDWDADDEVLLNTAIIGAQGAVLPRKLENGAPIPTRKISKRVALARWHRRSVGWTPLWLNTRKGNFAHEPGPVSWGRLEKNRLTALVLRESSLPFDRSTIRNSQFQGRWAIISQDDQSIFDARKVALIPFDGGFVEMPLGKAPSKVVAVFDSVEKLYKNWTFQNGRLRINAQSVKNNPSLNGFLVFN